MGGLLVRMTGLSALISVAYFALHLGFVALLGTSVPADPVQIGVAQKVLLGVIGAAFLALLFIQQLLPRLSQTALGRAAYVHFYGGLYADSMLTEFVRGFGPTPGGVAGRRRLLNADPSHEVQS